MKVLMPPPLFNGNTASTHLHPPEATTEPMVKTHQNPAYLQHLARSRLQNVLTFTCEPITARIYSYNNPEKRLSHFPIYSAIASQVLTFMV